MLGLLPILFNHVFDNYMTRLQHLFVLGVLSIFGAVGLISPMFAALDTGIGFGASGTPQIAAEAAGKVGYSQTNEFTLSMIIGLVVQSAFGFFGILFTLLTVYAGFNWMTAQGDTGKVEIAQNTIQQAVIGMVICFSGYGISNFVLNTFFG